MEKCHLCGAHLPHHDDECRAHRDLALFARVYRRLNSEARNPLLQASLKRQLIRHGCYEHIAG
ncbi:MAG TPA: hypothetical protein VL974_13355 [Magnetospirillum sp.]|jgi:hypothetical protein|nr:hypothetical protein [Magnetospirillum sp.]